MMTEHSDVLARLEILWRKLEDEGLYVRANTVFLAIEEIKRLRIIEDARKCPPPNSSTGSQQ